LEGVGIPVSAPSLLTLKSVFDGQRVINGSAAYRIEFSATYLDKGTSTARLYIGWWFLVRFNDADHFIHSAFNDQRQPRCVLFGELISIKLPSRVAEIPSQVFLYVDTALDHGIFRMVPLQTRKYRSHFRDCACSTFEKFLFARHDAALFGYADVIYTCAITPVLRIARSKS
jgi:hypothetical protein